MELWELAARERIRDTVATYNWSGDALRLDGVAAAFCADGQLEVRGRAPLRGRAAIVAFLGGVAADADTAPHDAAGGRAATEAGRRIVRHHVTNLRFLELTPTRARTECYFAVLTEIGLDHFGRYRDALVPVDDRWLIEHRFVSTDWRAPDSSMAPPDSVS
jgi:hypothetical protein